MTASRRCCRFVGCIFMMRISRSSTSHWYSIGLRSDDCGGHLSLTRCHFSQKVWEDFSFVTWHVILQEVAIRRWVIKGWTWSETILRSLVFKWCSIGTKRPNVCQENIPYTITPPAAWTVDSRQDECPPSKCHCKIETHQTRQCFSNHLLSMRWACVKCEP